LFLLGFVILLSQLRHLRFPGWWFLLPHKSLASFSYSLYVLHTSILVFLMAMLQTFAGFPRQLQPGWRSYALYAAFCLVTYLVSYVFATLTEYKTQRLRRWMNNRLRALRSQGWA
jgi:peptidoglycan/LPS O-acetylase OafA/YrhL